MAKLGLCGNVRFLEGLAQFSRCDFTITGLPFHITTLGFTPAADGGSAASLVWTLRYLTFPSGGRVLERGMAAGSPESPRDTLMWEFPWRRSTTSASGNPHE